MKSAWIRGGSWCLLAVVASVAAADRAEAESLRWHSNLQQAAKESMRSQKPMLIEITAEWCGYCKKMKQTYNDEQIVRHVSGCFVPVTVDADENERLVAAVGADALPTTVIVSSDFKLLKKITGYQTPSQLDAKLGEICQTKHEVVEELAKADADRVPSLPKSEKVTFPVRAASDAAVQPAFEGHCLVSLLEDQKLKQCGAAFTSEYRGNVIRFASADYKQKFDADPLKYWPVLDGACPVSLVEQNKRAKGKAEWGAIYHDELWFFVDEATRDRFANSPRQFTSRIE